MFPKGPYASPWPRFVAAAARPGTHGANRAAFIAPGTSAGHKTFR